jgi:predicted ArsR family transcriptional regulator
VHEHGNDPLPLSTIQEQARALGDPTRHAIFRYVLDAPDPVGVGELTDHFGLNHNAVRQHLTKLVAADLVLEGRASSGGPGRPRLVYTVDPATESRWGATGPYERLALALSEVIRTGATPVEIGRRIGRREAAAHPNSGAPVEALVQAMARSGFEPTVEERRSGVDVVLQTCPFASTALADPDIICELHRGLAAGVAEHVGGVVVSDLVRHDPRRAQCRLRLQLDPDVLPADHPEPAEPPADRGPTRRRSSPSPRTR